MRLVLSSAGHSTSLVRTWISSGALSSPRSITRSSTSSQELSTRPEPARSRTEFEASFRRSGMPTRECRQSRIYRSVVWKRRSCIVVPCGCHSLGLNIEPKLAITYHSNLHEFMIISKDLSFSFQYFAAWTQHPHRCSFHRLRNLRRLSVCRFVGLRQTEYFVQLQGKLCIARQPYRTALSRLRLARTKSGSRNGRFVVLYVTHTGRCRED